MSDKELLSVIDRTRASTTFVPQLDEGVGGFQHADVVPV